MIEIGLRRRAATLQAPNRLLLMVAAMGALVCLFWGLLWHLRQPYVVQRLDAGNDYRIDIMAEPTDGGFGPTGMSYEIWRAGRLLYSRHYFGDPAIPTGEEPFDILSLDKGKVVGVYQKKCPLVLHLMFDKESSEIWPRNDGKGGNEAERSRAVGERLIERVRTLTGDNRYRFDYYPSARTSREKLDGTTAKE